MATYGGPYLFGKLPSVADAMYAPVVSRFLTYDMAIDKTCAAYCSRSGNPPHAGASLCQFLVPCWL